MAESSLRVLVASIAVFEDFLPLSISERAKRPGGSRPSPQREVLPTRGKPPRG